jgi:hypothetical protein
MIKRFDSVVDDYNLTDMSFLRQLEKAPPKRSFSLRTKGMEEIFHNQTKGYMFISDQFHTLILSCLAHILQGVSDPFT